MKVSDYIIEYLSKLGIEQVFYVPGGGAMHMNDSLGANPNVEAVSMIFEQGAAIAAEAYARVRDGFGACLVTSGPGATNALTGLVGAYIDSIPVIFISGQAKRDDLVGDQKIRQFGIQEVNIISMVQSYSKYATQIQNPEDMVYELEKASSIAVEGRPGPVWLDIPLDIQASQIDVDSCRHYEKNKTALLYANHEPVNWEYEAADDDITKVIGALNNSKRPLLIIGHGIRLSHSIESARELYEYLGVPVLTSWNGVDLIEDDNPLFFGRPGAVGHRASNFIQQTADVVITIGTRLNLLNTGYNYESFLENATHIMVDIDENEMNKKSVHPNIKVVCDANSFIRKLLERKDEIRLNDMGDWKDYCKKLWEKYPNEIPEQASRAGFVSNYHLVKEVSDNMNGDDIYQFTSSGTTVDIAMKTFHIKRGQRAFLTKGLAAMGYDVPASIGSCIASGRRTVCITGDGSIAMNLQELEVIRRRKLPIKIFVSDNQGYSMIYGSQNGNFHRLTGCTVESGLTLPDMETVAEAFGIKGMHINSEEELNTVVKAAMEYDGPVVVRVNTDIEQKILPKQANYMKEDGQMASRPLDDMMPLLERGELESVRTALL